MLLENQFVPLEHESRFGALGNHYALPQSLGSGIFWLYEPNRLFNIKIHDFYFDEDFILNVKLPEGLSITYYESVSGEELSPYKRMVSNMVRTHLGGETPFRALMHRKIPIRSVGIEIKPEYYNDHLRTNYPGEFRDLGEVFRGFSDTSDFPDMVSLLNRIKHYRGEGAAARLFYEAKVAEAVSLVVEFQKTKQNIAGPRISGTDREIAHSVAMYIRDHYAGELTQEHLTRIAGVCATKLKSLFKTIHNSTITEFIQNCRMSQARHLLQYTDLPVNQIARAVGYNSASRFSELFKRNTGLMPKEYRRRL